MYVPAELITAIIVNSHDSTGRAAVRLRKTSLFYSVENARLIYFCWKPRRAATSRSSQRIWSIFKLKQPAWKNLDLVSDEICFENRQKEFVSLCSLLTYHKCRKINEKYHNKHNVIKSTKSGRHNTQLLKHPSGVRSQVKVWTTPCSTSMFM